MSDLRTLSAIGAEIALVIMLAFTDICRAEARDLYTIEDVRVDERAVDELEAKKIGIKKAQREALRDLIKKITLRDNHINLPYVDKKSVQTAIRDYAIIEEKFGGGRYLAKLTIRFKRSAVRNILQRRKLLFAETVSRPLVVLPVYRAAGSVMLWDDPNPWHEAWANRPSSGGLLPLVLPIGDYSDVAVINAIQVLQGSEEHLSAIAEKYKAIGTLVTIAELNVNPKSGSPSIEVSMTRFGKGDSGRTFVRSFYALPDENIRRLLGKAVETLSLRAEEDWKRDTLQRISGEQWMNVKVPLKSLLNWLRIRKRITNVSTVMEVRLIRISVNEAILKLKYTGGPDQIRLSMAQSELDLRFENKRGIYILRLARP